MMEIPTYGEPQMDNKLDTSATLDASMDTTLS